jgi:hypothetical protein
MRRLPRPHFGVRATMKACIESVRDASLRQRLGDVFEIIERAERDYLSLGEPVRLYTIVQSDGVGGVVSGQEMERIYSGTFVKSAQVRNFYDVIKKLPPNDICPICGLRTVSTLDHYLAKSRHPSLTIVPLNLVPACADCNKAKLDSQPATAEEQTLHPYFDDFDDARWLYAAIGETVPARLLFRAEPPENWPELRRSRVLHHFRTFGLAKLFGSYAADELSTIRHYLSLLQERGNAATIQSFLREQAESCALAQQNSWKTAAYYAFSESEWFCSGGFALVDA